MRLDQENIFFEKPAAELVDGVLGDTIATGGGDSVNPMWLYVGPKLESGSVVLTLETADDTAFTDAVSLCSFKLDDNAPIRGKVPLGVKNFLRIKASESTTPTNDTALAIVAALAVDVDFK